MELRTEYQKVFKLDNGNYEYRIYSNPVHYFNGEEMEEISDINSFSFNTLKNTNDVSKSVLEQADKNNENYFHAYAYEDLVSEKNELEKLFNNNSNRYTQVNNEYLITEDEFYYFPVNHFMTYSRNNLLVTSEYDTKEILDKTTEYPLTLVNESIVLDNSNSVIRDKYVTLGMSGSTESSVLLAGSDRLQFVDQNNNLVTAKYVTIIEIDFPDIKPNYIVSAKIGIEKNTTTSNANRNPDITLSKVTSNIDYDNFEGTTSFANTQIATGNGTASNYLFDITSLIVSSVSSDSKLLLTIEGSETGYASFYSTESNHTSSPYVSFEVTENGLGGTLYGDAPSYVQVDSQNVNCFGYALLQNQWVTMSLTSKVYTNVYNEVKFVVESYGYEIREIDSYNSDIYPDERRIAFRYDIKDLNCWHFVRQNSDGSWSAKLGSGNCGQYSITVNPDSDSMWNMYAGLQGKGTHYYAIK